MEEEGGLPPASVAGEGTVVQKVSPTLPSALGWQETQGMETRQGCVEEEGAQALPVQLPEPCGGGSGQRAEDGGFACSSRKSSQATRPEA